MTRYKPIGNATDKAWLAGWDAAVSGYPRGLNPYKREPQVHAWDKGWIAGYWSGDPQVRTMKRIANRRCPGTYTDI